MSHLTLDVSDSAEEVHLFGKLAAFRSGLRCLKVKIAISFNLNALFGGGFVKRNLL